MISEKINLEKIERILSSYPKIQFAYLYGSFAMCAERSWSDLDIALLLEDSVAQTTFFDLELEISKKIDAALPGVESDVRIFNLAPLNYKIQIVQNGKLIFSQDETKRVDFETRVRSEYFDFLPLRLTYQNAFLEGIEKGGLLWSTRKK